MYAKFCVNRETASSFMRLFVNRRAYAIQGDRPLPNGSVPYYPARDWKTKEPKPLDDGVVRMHLNVRRHDQSLRNQSRDATLKVGGN
jgi:hypothetical protein